MSDFVGKFISHYRLEAFLGDGGMGTVYRAYDTNLERQVALKLMHAHYARQPEFQARLSQEARSAAMLDHPSIVRIYDFGESDEGLFIAMEYISGGSLRSHLTHLQQQHKFLPLKQSLQIGAQIAEALDYAHDQGVVHRDVKPGNIILKPLNRPDTPGEQPFRAVLTDFGLVKLQEETTSLTRTGTTLGTPTYMSPEQCEGKSLDGRSDLYSLGVVLYELFTNKLPFQFKSLSEAVATHMRGEMPHPPRAIRSDLPSIIDTIITKSLAKAPGDRYQNGNELQEKLRSAIAAFGETTTQVIPGGRERYPENPLGAEDFPPGFKFQIKTPGRESNYATLARPTITIGRFADNDIVLPVEGVSRYHARAQATRTGWEIVDLGGVNGTWIGERKLQPNIPTPMKAGETLHIGPYQLVLEGPANAEPATVPQYQNIEMPTSARSTEPYDRPGPQSASDAPLELFLARDTMTIEPGRRAELKVEVANRSHQNDRVNLRVYGVPSDWVQVPDTFIPVPAGGSTTIPIIFQPPRRAETAAGRQRIRIELNSQQFRDLRSAAGFNLILEPFEAFSLEMNPRNLRLPGVVQVLLRNTGNSAAEYSLVGRDQGNHIQFQGERGRIRLVPDQVATIDLQLEPRSQSWFGSYETHGFEIDVASRSGARQSISGNAETAPILPISLGYGALFVVVFLCALAALLVGRSLIGTETTPTVTITTPPLVDPGTATAVSATQTALAATVNLSGDSDGDGLSNALELEIGTLPNNRDSDGDGLSDWEEVVQYGTTPTKPDSDGDTINDFLELQTYHTNPNKADTDGDGIDDNVEIDNGTDPNNPLSPSTPTPTTESTITITPSSANKPDLVISGDPVITLNYSGCQLPNTSPGTKVTIRNFGTANAGSFVVSISGIQQTINNLPVGGGQDVFVQTTLNPVVVVVDVNGNIDESNETNNTFNGSVPLPTPAPTCTPTPSITPSFTPSITPVTPVPTTETPTMEPTTETPTYTPTPTDTATATPTFTPTPTPTYTDTPPPIGPTPLGTSAVPTTSPPASNPLVNCTTVAPTLDGVLAQNEWGLLPMVEFGPQGGPEYNVAVYFMKDATTYYLAFEIGDPTDNELTDSLRVYFDVTNNAGDPDTTDRFFQVVRDGTMTIQAGRETNSDSLDWSSDYSSSSWSAVVGEPEADQWVVEMSIASSEMPILADGNPFHMMSMVLYTGLIHPWPENAITDNAGTWQEIDNQNCQ